MIFSMIIFEKLKEKNFLIKLGELQVCFLI